VCAETAELDVRLTGERSRLASIIEVAVARTDNARQPAASPSAVATSGG